MNVIEAVVNLDQSSDLHAARILLLLNAFTKGDQLGSIEGLTKLAKLDFLLRYPVMLERALNAREKSTKDLKIEENERYSVESQMVRYRFGPWDHRYREILNLLIAKGLASVSIEGRKVVITITSLGNEKAAQLAGNSLFSSYARRAKILKTHFDYTATNLMRFIYATFPEIVSLRSNSKIST